MELLFVTNKMWPDEVEQLQTFYLLILGQMEISDPQITECLTINNKEILIRRIVFTRQFNNINPFTRQKIRFNSKIDLSTTFIQAISSLICPMITFCERSDSDEESEGSICLNASDCNK